jgi:hypothetical protein
MYAVNISDVSISLLFPIILIFPLFILGMMWLLNKYYKDLHRAGFVVFVLTLWFFYYIPFKVWVSNIKIGSFSIDTHWVLFTLWTLIFMLLVSNWIWRRIKQKEIITMYLNLLCILLIIISIIRTSLDLIPRYIYRPDISNLVQSLPKSFDSSSLPDIYYIILDGYARQDILQELYNYDNSDFIKSLTDRGFYVASKSQSNYIQTVLSLASSLNMEYLSGNSGSIPNHGQLLGMITNSRSRAFLEYMGYKYVAFSTGYEPTALTNADYYYSSADIGKSHDLEALLLINSILAPVIEKGLIKAPITRYSDAQERVNFVFDSLENEIPNVDGPKFVFTHIVAPHPPFIFDQNGPISQNEFFIFQGIDSYQGSINGYKQAYVSDLIYINNQIIQSIDGILLNSKTPPIIIIQADHGPDAYMDWSSGKNKCLKERFSILNAYYFPDARINQLSQDISPVNTFPLIFNTYFGTEIDILQNHPYFATWKNPYPFNDVSEISQTCEIK